MRRHSARVRSGVIFDRAHHDSRTRAFRFAQKADFGRATASCESTPQSGLLGAEFEDVAGLTLERLADPLERLEAYAFYLAGLEQRHVLLGDADALRKLL